MEGEIRRPDHPAREPPTMTHTPGRFALTAAAVVALAGSTPGASRADYRPYSAGAGRYSYRHPPMITPGMGLAQYGYNNLGIYRPGYGYVPFAFGPLYGSPYSVAVTVSPYVGLGPDYGWYWSASRRYPVPAHGSPRSYSTYSRNFRYSRLPPTFVP
jgi:hypothetical protein